MAISYIKNREKKIQKYRFLAQSFFALLCMWIGIEFYFYVDYLQSAGMSGLSSKPEGVDGFLPISALMSVYYFLQTGELHGAHPAGFFILLGILAMSFFVGKSFCSWLCPIGFISELIGDFGEKVMKKVFGRVPKIPLAVDYILRTLKYLLLFFFVYVIFFQMTQIALKSFLDSPYNLLADVKMFYFFAELTKTSIIVIAVLFGLSIFIRNFWCRYLCPYGALLGIISFFSPNRIKRDASACIDCKLCTKACPSRINVHKVNSVVSDECSSCMSCIDACPVKDTLQFRSTITKRKFSKFYAAGSLVMIYFIIIGLAMISGNWKSKTPDERLFLHMKNINSLSHPRSTADVDHLNKKAAETFRK